MNLKHIVKLLCPYGFFVLWKKKMKPAIIKRSIYKKIRKLPKSEQKKPQFIITLTSYGKRLKRTAPYAIASLLSQKTAPDRIILWTVCSEKIPGKLQKLMEYGLEVKFCEDIRSYKKLIPALQKFPEDVLVTADDDILYPADWFSKLKNAYQYNPSSIYCHRAHEILFDENKKILPYLDWRWEVKSIEQPKRLFPTGVGGILYPPHSLDSHVTDVSLFTRLAPFADDIWFWAMTRLAGTQVSLVKDNYNEVFSLDTSVSSLAEYNNDRKGNDEQLAAVLTEFPQILEQIR
jgi:hypothetical protein